MMSEPPTIYEFNLKPHLPFNANDLKGWGKDFVIAGGFIHDIVHDMVPNDIDIWVFSNGGFYELLNYFSKRFESITYKIYPSVIELVSPVCTYPIQLINAIGEGKHETGNYKVISKFDMDYTRCFFDGNNTYVQTDCEEAWRSQVIRNCVDYGDLRPSRILKAHKKGFRFEKRMAVAFGVPIGYPSSKGLCGYLSGPLWSEPIQLDSESVKRFERNMESPLSDHLILATTDLNVVKKYFHHTVIHNVIRNSGSNYEEVPKLDGFTAWSE